VGIAQPSVEALDMSILHRPSRLDVHQPNLPVFRPAQHATRCELWSVVRAQTPESIRQAGANIFSIYDRLPGDRRLMIMIRGAGHYMFSDDGAMLKSPLVLRVIRTLGIVRIDGRRQVAVTEHYISIFFDVYLKGALASELRNRPEYPEIKYVR
jgi:hypothetical protein